MPGRENISLAKRPGRGKKKAGELFSYIYGKKPHSEKEKESRETLAVHRQRSPKAKLFIKILN